IDADPLLWKSGRQISPHFPLLPCDFRQLAFRKNLFRTLHGLAAPRRLDIYEDAVLVQLEYAAILGGLRDAVFDVDVMTSLPPYDPAILRERRRQVCSRRFLLIHYFLDLLIGHRRLHAGRL